MISSVIVSPCSQYFGCPLTPILLTSLHKSLRVFLQCCLLSDWWFFLSLRYKIALLKPSVKALMVSTRTSIRTDNRGFLSMQYMIKMDEGQVCFAEYFVSSLFSFCSLKNSLATVVKP